ncbi:RND transporter [Sulfurimicrobium lacus]|uniref:RND transporter n=1 Tax=Sulfurimicrobium lacus TaxID=2715678 RepID=A0A6F8VC90_9PROT|nr:efflux RND transporter periplasmic adaptor subunit [Sulfurimicrobium lacus]BCB27338.1 RND transporter [Sulfurimicrobium lacus]
MKSNRNFARPPLAAGLIFLLALGACGKAENAAAPAKAVEKAAPVRVEIVKKAPLLLTIALTGSVEAGRIAQLASPAEGPICCTKVREGDAVGKGQAVLNLGRREGATALVASLNEDLKKEEDNLARTRRLVETGALPGEQLDIAAANAIRARAQLAKARETTQDYAVVAPWAGVVSKVKVRDGDFVAPRAPLAEIYDPGSLMVRFAVPEQEAASLALGMKAQVELDAYSGKRFAASITRLYPYLDTRTHTRTAEVTIADAPKLLPGMFARAYLVKETIADAITVPAYSLVAVPGGGFAAFVVKDGKAVRRKVETGIEVDGRVRIVSGLDAGDKLIVAGQEKLKDGAAVKLPDTGAKKAGDAAKTSTDAATAKAAQP